MKCYKKLIFVFVLIQILSISFLFSNNTTLPVYVAPDNPKIRLIGRFTKDKYCFWTGSLIEMKFFGKGIGIKFNADGRNFFQVVLDNKTIFPLEVIPGKTNYILADGLKESIHTISLFKRTEALFRGVQFLGFNLSQGGKVLDLTNKITRRIEVLGDSISCGYGNEASSPKDKFCADTENGYMTYWAIAARELNAYALCIAWSGKGIYRNRGKNNPYVNTMRDIYKRIPPGFKFSDFIPDVYIINLGTNDFAEGIPDEWKFIKAYKEQIKEIRKNAPNAYIFCCVGHMLGKRETKTLHNWLDRMIKELGDEKIRYLEFKSCNSSTGFGADYHPSVSCHKEMAETLISAIKEILNW